ncbi:hypothetical protein ABPG74_015091 [Tetrahymena malaccensis]
MDHYKNKFHKNEISNLGSYKTDYNSNLANTPLSEISQSVLPLNHQDEDKHSFLLEGPYTRQIQNSNGQQQNISNMKTMPAYYGDLNHLRGAEQRKKLFMQHRNSDLSDQLKQQDEEQQEVHSPSLTSKSFIFRDQENIDDVNENKSEISGQIKKRIKKQKSSTISDQNVDSSQRQMQMQGVQSKIKSQTEIGQAVVENNKKHVMINVSTKTENFQQNSSSQLGAFSAQNTNAKLSLGYMEANDKIKGSNPSSNNQSFVELQQIQLNSNFGKGQICQDLNNAKSSLSNAFNENLDKNEFDASILKNKDMSIHQSDSALNFNAAFIPKNANQNSLNFNAFDIKTLDVVGNGNQLNSRNMRRGSNLLEIPSPSQIAAYTNQTNTFQRRNSDKSQISQRTQNKTKKRNFLKAFYFTYKFLQIMRFVRKYKNIYMLEKKHFKLIKDNAFGGLYERLGQRNTITKIFSKLSYYLFDIKSPFHAFQPTSLPLLIFEFSILIILLFLTFYIPLKVCFTNQIDFNEPQNLTTFINIVPYILMLEMIINLNTAYFSQGTTIVDRKLIIKRYFKFKFWIDIISIICLDQSSIIPLIFIIRVYQIFKILYDFDESFQIQFKFPTTFELTKLCFIILYVAHIFACGFKLILNYQSNEQETWIAKTNVFHKSWIEIYIAALYFAFTTMITVGFGDIVPYSLIERVYVIIMQLISCGVFAYAINTIGSIFQEIAKKSAEYRQQKQEIIDYMMRRKITKQTQIKVLKYLEYIHSSSDAGHQKGYEILNLLSKRLRDVVYKEYYGRILIQYKLFSRKFSEKFLKTLSLYMREQTLGPGEVLYNEGELDQRLFYVQSGEIELYTDLQENGHKDLMLHVLKQGDYFGQFQFLGNMASKNAARSLNVSQIVYCTLDDFISVIRQFPNDFEIYCSMKDSINFSDEKLDVMCSGCGRYNHQVHNCPLLHYEIDKEAHIRRYIHSDPQKGDKNFSRVKPYFSKWASKMQSQTNREGAISSNKKKEKDFQYQRFNVKREYQDLRIALRMLRIRLRDSEEKNLSEEQLQKIYNEQDDRKFILETDVPNCYYLQIHRQKNFLNKRNGQDDEENDEEDDDLYEEEFADYEDIMNNDHSQVTNVIYNNVNQQSYQKMSTLNSQIHVPTEKSLYIKMPSEHNFKASGMDSKVMEESSEDYEDDDSNDNNKKISKNSASKHDKNNQITFKEENQVIPPRKQSNSHFNKQQQSSEFNQQYADDDQAYQQKSVFYRGHDQNQGVSPSPTARYQNRHKTLNPSSFNNLSQNVETYFKGSQNDNNPSSMSSIALQQQYSKRKGTVLSSIHQGSSKLKQQGSQDFSINIQRTGTLNSKGFAKNSSKKLSERNILTRSNTGKMSKKESTKDQSKIIQPSLTQLAKFANTIRDNYSEKINKNQNGSQYSSQYDQNLMFCIMDFEKQCEFVYYLPQNNLSVVLKSLKKIFKSKQEQIFANNKSVKTFKTFKTMKMNGNSQIGKKAMMETPLNLVQANMFNNHQSGTINYFANQQSFYGNALPQDNSNQNALSNLQNQVAQDKQIITINVPQTQTESPPSSNFKPEKKQVQLSFKLQQ